MTSAQSAGEIRLHYSVSDASGRWFMDLEDVPETPLHDLIIELMMSVLRHRYRQQDVLVARNLGCRWDPEDARVGVDPDIVVVEPKPPEGEALSTLRVWMPGHNPPRLAIEVVSEHNADKDYNEGPARLARLGAEELWIFDPELRGPTTTGGPFPLQIWSRKVSGDGVDMERVHAGTGPAYSSVLGAWAVTANDGQRLRIADDEEGGSLWRTQAEAAEDKAAAAGAQAEAARARADAAEAELRRLRALLEQK